MQPHFPTGGRVSRHLFPVLLLSVGVALWATPMLAPTPVLGAEDGHAYHRLPVVGRDWTVIGDSPDGSQRMEREKFRQGEYFRRWQAIHRIVGPQHVSRKGQDILAKRGLGSALLAEGADQGKAFAGVDTLKVLIIRIGFHANRDSHLTTIDPGGDFVLTPPPDEPGLLIDPPPHNKAFYESHLQGLSEYYNYQSGGRLHIEGRVLPEGDNDSYKLSDVADYGPGTEGFWTIEGLESLVRDMIVLSDEGTSLDGSANLSDYDDDSPFTYIIFVHAGSDWQSDINGDSPNDIPTFFVTLGEPQDLPASGGALSECSIIPETTNQDGYPGSIAAAFYHEFGHALGLVDVYNTSTGLPQVGIWDLMDSGTNLPVVIGQEEDDGSISFVTAVGVLPPSLGVWNKWFLGWVEMEEVDNRSDDYFLPAIEVPREQYPMWDARSGDFDLSYPQAIKAGPSSREYFLLENRYVPFPDSTSTYTPYSAFSFERDEATGVILYLAGERAGSWSNSGMYDFFLPAGGVLAWHVNNDVIEPNLESNTINANGDGLRLLEADGIQDVGVLDSYVLGWYGSWRDPFGEENGFQNIYTDAFPSSRMYDRSWSGLSVSDIRQQSHRSASVMQFSASINPLAENFPWEVAPVDSLEAAIAGGQRSPRGLDPTSATPFELGGQRVLIFADAEPAGWSGAQYPASLFAINDDGTPRWSAPGGKPEGVFQTLDAPLAGSPAVIPEFLGAEVGLAWATRAGTVGLTSMSDGVDPGGWTVSVGDSLVYGPLVTRSEAGLRIVNFVAPDSLVLVDHLGNQVGPGLSLADETGLTGASFASLPRQVNRLGSAQFLVFLDQGIVPVDLISGLPEFGVPLPYPRDLTGTLQTALAKVGLEDRLWLFDDLGFLSVWTATPGDFYPSSEAVNVSDPLVAEPAVADLDGDGRNDLVLLTATQILAFQENGIPVRGFPVRFYDLFPLDPETRISGPVVVADATGDGVNEIHFNTTGGHLMSLDATGRLQENTPFLWGDTAAAGFAVSSPSLSTGKSILYMISAGGYTGSPMGRQFYNGRITGFELTHVPAGNPITSGWFGPAGGARRSGAEGLPQDLGSSAPAAAEQNLTYVYPNPLHDQFVTVRFYSEASGQARFELYNLQGEEVSTETFTVLADRVIEHRFDCSMARSGIYLGRLVYPGASGTVINTLTLAVER